MSKVQVKDVDKGYKKLLKQLENVASRMVQVGIFEAEGGEEVSEGMTVGAVAEIHEFGLGTSPERSWLRAWVDESQADIKTTMTKLFEAVVQGKRTKEEALELFGMWAVGKIQERISAGIGPELKPATVQRKGSTVALINTGQFRASITFKVIWQ